MNFIVVLLLLPLISWLPCYRCDVTMYSDIQIKELYEDFLSKYPRQFENETTSYEKRLKIFRDNVKLIEESNSANSSAVYGISKFADWTDEEFNAFSGPLHEAKRRVARNDDYGWIRVSWDGSPYPQHWDWRDYGVVTAIKTQSYKCNSCYAYAVTAVVESLFAIKYKRYISISEYELLDCDYSNDGCISGSTRRSMARGKYMGFTRMTNYPQMLWHNYFCPPRGEYFVSRLYAVDPDPHTIAWFVSNVAPVALNLAFPKRYKFYKQGVLPDSYECWVMEPNHAAEVIGYGVERGKKYWLMKNSWGDWWGDGGFFKIERGINACQIETHATSAGL